MASRRQLSFTEEEEPEGQLCALCRHHHSHISKVSTWKRTQDKEFLADYGVNEDDFACRPYRDDVRRLVRSQGPTQIHRWEKKKKEVRCCVKGCGTFLRSFFQHAEFITGATQYTKGSLADTELNDDSHKLGFLAFMRLIGVVYFKKYNCMQQHLN